MELIKIKFDVPPEVKKKLISTWSAFAKYILLEYTIVDEGQDIVVGENSEADIQVSKKFVDNLESKTYASKNYFDLEPLIYSENGAPDYLGTSFYLLNCLQEYNDEGNERTGRFSYKDSFQKEFKCEQDNLVGSYFDKLLESVPSLKNNFRRPDKPSRYFLSHDNDVLHGSFAQDGLYALKNARFDIVLKLIFNELLGKPEWRNMSRIMDIEDEYDIKSTFFWLVNQGKHNGITNADYNIDGPPIRQLMAEIDNRGWLNGLHKSSSNESYSEEINKLNIPVTSNRNHFLRINLPDTYEQIEAANLDLDCSVGFAEKLGFRNGYALPIKPFDMKRDQEFDFLEINLHVMDATLYNYEKLPPKEGKKRVLDFLEKQKSNAVISILWHNKYFTGYKYKGYLDIYKSILDFIVQNKMSTVSVKELTTEYLKR